MIPPTTNPPTSPHSTVRIGKKTAVAAVAALAVALAFVPRGEAPATPVAAPAAKATLPAVAALTFPPPPAAKATFDTPEAAPTEEYGRRLCDACLPERAVLDVANTYLRRLDPIYLEGEIRAHPVADVVPEPIPRGEPARGRHLVSLPKLPSDLVGAPEDNPFGLSVNPREYPVETAWFVWVQTGWIPRERIERMVVFDEPGVVVVSPEEFMALESGDVTLDELRPGSWKPGDEIRASRLPQVALSWPPIKKETYIVIDSRTGELRPDGIFHDTWIGIQPPYPPHHGEALDMARERAGEWFRGEATLPPGA